MQKKLVIFVSFLIFIGCATHGPVKNFNVKSNEAIAIGRIKISYNGEDITSKAIVLFNEIMWGTYSCKADKTGFIALRLPIGQNHIAWVQMKNYHITLPKDYATFNISENSKYVYIGDMDIKWTCPKNKTKMGVMFGAIGGLIDGMSKDGEIAISVIDNLEETKKIFCEKYKSDCSIISSIIKIKE